MAFTYYRVLAPDPTKISGITSDFVALVSITDATLKSVANGGHVQSSSGFDIAFGDGSTTYKWEIESYNASTGAFLAWVKIPVLREETQLYILYGDAAITTDQSDPVNTWSNYLGVYHFGDGTTLSVTSATGTNNGTNQGATAATGQVRGGASFVSASSQYIDLGTGINPTAITISAWVKATSFPAAYNSIVARNNTGNTQYCFWMVNSSGKMVAYVKASGSSSYDGSGSTTLSPGTWYHTLVSYDSNNGLKGFVNGVLDGSSGANGAIDTTTATTNIGREVINTRLWNGVIDEVRIASVARSQSWAIAEYNNGLNPSTFFTVGSENTGTPSVLPPLTTLFSAVTGYPDDVADWADTTPQPGSSSSGTDILSFTSPFLWPSFNLAPGVLNDTSLQTTKTVYIKTFEDGTAPRLSFGVQFGYLFALLVTWIATLYSTLSFHTANTKASPRQMLAVVAFIGTTSASFAFTKMLTAILSFVGVIQRKISTMRTAVLSFAGTMAGHVPLFLVTLMSRVNFRGKMITSWTQLRFQMYILITKVRKFVEGAANFYFRPPIYIDSEQSIPATATAINMGALTGQVIRALLVYNIDPLHTVEIDVSSTFNKFPQSVEPGGTLFLRPDTSSTLYARSNTGTTNIRVIAC